MDHLFFGTIILAVLGVGLLLTRVLGNTPANTRQMHLAERARKRRRREANNGSVNTPTPRHQKIVLRRELNNVPTPWGWPGGDFGPGGLAGPQQSGLGNSSISLKLWVDRLLAEKRTVDDSLYRERGNAALRAMVEDRFGRVPQPQTMDFQKVRPPLLQDPDRPHDQMDNFPSGRTEAIISRLTPQRETVRAQRPTMKTDRAAQLGDIKTPWGW